MILITCGEGDEIYKQLEQYSIPKDKIYIPDLAMLYENDYDFIWTRINELYEIYQMLSDEKSKKVFTNILNYRLEHRMDLLNDIYEDSQIQYFDHKLIQLKEDDLFLDCGAYIGDTLDAYLAQSKGNYRKIICCEADDKNFESLNRKVEKENLENIQLTKVALWNEKGEVKFNNIGSGSGTIDLEKGKIHVKANTIDCIVGKEKVSHIKMDIEGAEYEALMGAYKTIKRDMPNLMISVYHKQDDFIKIPLLIKSISPSYRLYFRHYRKFSMQETVCYAVR